MSDWLRRAAFAAAGISMGFTAYFGWVTGGDDRFAQYFNAAGGALISAAVPLFFLLVSYAEQRKAKVPLRIFLICGVLFGAMDAGSNTGALFAMREGSRLDANHANKVSKDVHSRLASLERREATLLEKTSNVKVWRDTRSIKKNIADLEAKRERESKRGGCGRLCEGIDDELRKERDELAVSLTVEQANSELATIRKDIATVRAEAKKTPGKVSPIDVITNKIGKIANWDLAPNKSVQEFVYLVMTLVLGCGLTILSGGLGYGSSWLRGGAPLEEDQNTFASREWLPAPQPLHAEPAPPRPAQTFQATASATTNPDGMKETMEALERVMARVRERQKQRAASA